MSRNTVEDEEQMEDLVDRLGLKNTVLLLSDICAQKADEDPDNREDWEDASEQLDELTLEGF